jgi:hypothetical protein
MLQTTRRLLGNNSLWHQEVQYAFKFLPVSQSPCIRYIYMANKILYSHFFLIILSRKMKYNYMQLSLLKSFVKNAIVRIYILSINVRITLHKVATTTSTYRKTSWSIQQHNNLICLGQITNKYWAQSLREHNFQQIIIPLHDCI